MRVATATFATSATLVVETGRTVATVSVANPVEGQTAPMSEPRENPLAWQVTRAGGESTAAAMAHAVLRPAVQAALTVAAFNRPFGALDVNAMVVDLREQCRLASAGNLERAEAQLLAQAHSRDGLFNNLARHAALNVEEFPGTCETHLRLALKAQSQCRATLETLAAIQYPQSVAFVRQANIAHGLQQVNNGACCQQLKALRRLLREHSQQLGHIQLK